MTSEEENKALVRRFYAEMDAGNLDATPGPHEIEDQVAEGHRVVTRLTTYGTQLGVVQLPGPPG